MLDTLKDHSMIKNKIIWGYFKLIFIISNISSGSSFMDSQYLI